jgi:integrase
LEIRRIKFGTGENYSVLLDADGLPMPYPNLYLTTHHRNKSDASNTCHAVLEQIRYLYEIFEFMEIDIIQRCMEGDFLTKPELETLVKWSMRKVESFREHVAVCKAKNIRQLAPNRRKLETARSVILVNDQSDIAPVTSYNRITTYARYIVWLEMYFMADKKSSTEQWLLSKRPKRFSTNDESEDDFKSLVRWQVIRLLDVVRPDTTENPWKSEGIRYRNQLMVNLLEATGCRRGELARMRVDDFLRSPNNGRWYVNIRAKEDPDDKRMLRPEAKTKGRKFPLDKRMIDMIHKYIEAYRSQVNGVEYIPFLFVTHNHKISANYAISLSAISKVFSQITQAVKYRVHPHALRHSWNDRYSLYTDKRIQEGKVSEEKSETDRQKLMGWSANSKEAMRYSQRHRTQRALEFGLELQEKNSHDINLVVGAYEDTDIDF